LVLLGLLSCGLAAPSFGQVTDSTRTIPSDTLRAVPTDTLRAVPTDTLRAVPSDTTQAPVGFPPPEPGDAVGTTLPVRMIALDPPGVLERVPASFVYDFGTPGWPDGWSPYGLNPNHVGLFMDGLPMNDLITGRPRYDLIPLTFMEPLRTQAARDDAPVAVHGRVRDYDAAQPLTEMRYRTSNTGLQSVTVMHAQRRRPVWFGRPGRLNVLFGYGGHAAKGEYPGSRLRRARLVLGRIRYERPGWAVEVKDVFNRRRVGAHGGVLPAPGAPYESIFQRLGAQVENPDALRETIRNDLSAALRARLAPGLEALTLAGYWTNERFQYRNPSDTLTARVRRLGFRVAQDVRLGGHRLRLSAEGRRDVVRTGAALPDSLGLTRRQLHVAARDTFGLGALEAVLEGGFHRDDGVSFPTGFARLTWRFGASSVFAEGTHAGQPVSWVARYGFGGSVAPVGERPDGRLTMGRAGFTVRLGPFDLTAFGFVHELRDPLDLYVTAGDTVAARVASETWRRAGVAGDFGFRREAARGLYLVAQPTFVRFRAPVSADGERAAAALPELFGQARLGARFLLFQNDLDLNVYLRARYWGRMRSRTLHPQTGLLVLPEADARTFNASGTLDLYVEGGVRSATLFLAYENILSGTGLLVGNLIVPGYPLPERRLRFGVFWPILN
jgi:hypothetical protein